MEITKEMLTQRLADLQKDKDSLMANLQANNGAIQDCQYWLTIIEQEQESV